MSDSTAFFRHPTSLPARPGVRRRDFAGALAGLVLLPAVARSADVAPASAGGYRQLHGFDKDPQSHCGGAWPQAGLVRAADGYLYGTAEFGGHHSLGTIYRTRDGSHAEAIHSFGGEAGDGVRPRARLLLARDGALYGTTSCGNRSRGLQGTVFRLGAGGLFETVHLFAEGEGAAAGAPLIQARDGGIYGTTRSGGAHEAGTIFRVRPDGRFETLRDLSPALDGAEPVAGLLEHADGWLYGTTSLGGAHGAGTIFRIAADGRFEAVHAFAGAEGANPHAELVLGGDGAFYGTAPYGGAAGDGTIYRYMPGQACEAVLSFDRAGAVGAQPTTPLLLARDGHLYGTAGGGALPVATIFRLDATAHVSVLHTFPPYWLPKGALLELQGGVLVGALSSGGDTGYGAIYSLSQAGAAQG